VECDFCTASDVTHTHITAPAVVDGVRIRSWATCPECNELIQQDARILLLARCLRIYGPLWSAWFHPWAISDVVFGFHVAFWDAWERRHITLTLLPEPTESRK
jgi:hypothetical protein